MKALFTLIAAFAYLPFIPSSAGPELSNQAATGTVNRQKKPGTGKLLVYSGKIMSKVISAPIETIAKTPLKDIPSLPHKSLYWDIGLHVEIDASVGISYGVTMKQGSSLLVHSVMLYQFDQPYQTILYDYLRHSSSILKSSGGSLTGENKLMVTGSETVESLSCTHLREDNGNGNQNDHWMSKQVPGFLEIGNKVITIDPSLTMTSNDNIFKWGGLVKMTGTFNDLKAATFVNYNVALQEVNTDMDFPSSDFDVPLQ